MEKGLICRLQDKCRILTRILDERGRRLWAATKVRSLPFGGVSLLAKMTGMSRTTIHPEMGKLDAEEEWKAVPTGGAGNREGGASRSPSTPPIFYASWITWSSQAYEEIRHRPCVGRARALGDWRGSHTAAATGLGTGKWRFCCTICGIVSRRTRRLWKAASILIATTNSPTSTNRRKPFNAGASPSFPSIR